MTATSGTSTFDAAGDESAFADLCDQARDLAEAGHSKRAAQVYEQVLDGGSQRYRALAALGLAVVRHDLGEIRASRTAAQTAIDTGHAEFAPRAAYHLALSYEGEGLLEEAAAAWHRVLGSGNERYASAAEYGLARIAESRGDTETADTHWENALAGGDPDTVPEAARDFAERLLARGRAEDAARVVERGLAVGEHPGLRLLLGAVHVERAIEAFAAVAEGSAAGAEGRAVGAGGRAAGADGRADRAAYPGPVADPATAATAIELLARLLAVRGDADAAERVWEQGLLHSGDAVGEEVRGRLRRGFLAPGPEDGGTDAADPGETAWWDPYVEAAVAQDSAPMLTGELFLALNRMYSGLAVALAGNESHASALRRTVEEAVRTPSDYVWGRSLHDDFRERLRLAAGSDADILPANWPDAD
ncbi:tetratricopeptide repeat protein [Nocardiopsis sediminis]|uniref:Tetratricopeptide repeat protein n=1 Tax=Nocardiopsis sediminis TaxID=1778267 RepID=A0ABV8FK19_9ACTN